MIRKQIAIVMTEVFLRRLTPSLIPFVSRSRDFRVISIRRPLEELREVLLDLNPDGVITEWLPGVTEGIVGLGFPTVIADTDEVYPGVVSVDVDDWAVGAEAARAFRRAGFSSFACLGNGLPYSDQRVAGFCAEAGDGVAVFEDELLGASRYSEHFEPAGEGLCEWLRGLEKPVGVFAVHDPLGRFLCGTCATLGIRVPEEVAVIGANNDELVCGLSYPMLSSVSIPWDRIGLLVGEAMVGLLDGSVSGGEVLLVRPGGVEMRHSANHLVIEDEVLRRVMVYFSEHLVEAFTVEGMCDALRLGRRGVERRFRSFYGCTPWKMLCRMRVDRAKKLLVETNLAMPMVAEMSGFGDAERLAVVFKRVVGVTCSGWRRGG